MNKLYFFMCLVAVGVCAQTNSYAIENKVSDACVEESKLLHDEFVPIDFDKGRSTVGADQVEPVKLALQKFASENATAVITDIEIISSASKTPFYLTQGKKKVLDPLSDKKNFDLAKERVTFVEKTFEEIKKNSSFQKVKLQTKAMLAGPDFSSKDLNDRFVTHMTQDYEDKVEKMYQLHKTEFEEVAMKKTSKDLLKQDQFVNLYQAKFKPFLGFKVSIKGYKKEDMKCLTPATKKSNTSNSSKQ